MHSDPLAPVRDRLSRAQTSGESTFECMGRRFVVEDGVFPPTQFQSTGVFTRALTYEPGRSFLEIGSGAGVTAVTAALSGCRPVVASDISEEAVRNTQMNVDLHGVGATVSVRRGNLFEVLDDGERFDVIFWNSNFIYAPPEHVFTESVHRAFCDPGYAAHDRFLREAPRYLKPDGVIVLGFSPQGREDKLTELLGKYCYRVEVFSSAFGAGKDAPRYDLLRLRPTIMNRFEAEERG